MKTKLYPKKLTSLYLIFSALFLMATGFTSCKKKTEVTGTSYIQFVNASETSSPIDFYVDNNKTNPAPLTYNQSVGYFAISTESHPAAIKIAATGATVVPFTLTSVPNVYYSIFYFGGITTAYSDDLTAPQTGRARVRFINLNLGLTANIDFGITGGATLVTSLSSAINSSYMDVAPGASFSVYNTGTTTVLLTIPTTIQAGHIYTIYLSGDQLGSIAGNVLLQK